MKKKGFTLIELLAVIVILAIIAMILMPRISEIILTAKKATFKRTIEGVLEAAKYYDVEHTFSSAGDTEYPYEFICNGTSCKDGNNNELEFKGAVPKTGKVVVTDENYISAYMLCNNDFCGTGTKGNLSVVEIKEMGNIECFTSIGRIWNFTYLDDTVEDRYYTFNPTCDGTYKIELWGASGGTMDTDNLGGAGGYTKGNIELTSSDSLIVVVGGEGSNDVTSDATLTGGYNGGGHGSYNSTYDFECAGGGGSTDIRLVSEEFNDFDSLKSRIMIAAGGGGSCNDRDAFVDVSESYGGAGGGLNGYDGYGVEFDDGAAGKGATQTLAGQGQNPSHDGSFYQGCDSPAPNDDRAGAGGGYYGGSCSSDNQAAGGGSSYISGYAGCNSISGSSTFNNITHTDLPNHFSGKVFTESVMIDGKGCDWSTGAAIACGANQHQPDGTTTVGHIGNGYARITYLGA